MISSVVGTPKSMETDVPKVGDAEKILPANPLRAVEGRVADQM
jgi:hypothetical protein